MRLKKYCREPIENIKGYREAVESEDSGYLCHHINELTFIKAELKKMNMYFNRPASELVIMTRAEHKAWHDKWNGHPMKGKGYLISGEKHPLYGKGYLIAGEKNPMYGKGYLRTGDKNPAWKENPTSAKSWYNRANRMLKAGIITEDQANEYRKIAREIAKSKRNQELGGSL